MHAAGQVGSRSIIIVCLIALLGWALMVLFKAVDETRKRQSLRSRVATLERELNLKARRLKVQFRNADLSVVQSLRCLETSC